MCLVLPQSSKPSACPEAFYRKPALKNSQIFRKISMIGTFLVIKVADWRSAALLKHNFLFIALILPTTITS